MEKKKTNDSPSNFDDAFTKLGFSSPEEIAGATNLDDDILDKEDVLDVNKIEEPGKTEEVNEIDDTKGTDDKNVHDDDSDIPDDILNNKKSKEDNKEDGEQDTLNDDSTEDVDDDSDEVDPNEASQVGAFFDAFADALNWDVDDENRPDTIEGLVDYINDLVSENSKPDSQMIRLNNLMSMLRMVVISQISIITCHRHYLMKIQILTMNQTNVWQFENI